MEDIKYYKLLSEQYINTNSVITEMVNLQAIMNLPKGTEHFLSDIHGEYDPFYHILKNASGAIKMYIEEIYGMSMSEVDKKNLALLIYYPEERLNCIIENVTNKADFYKTTLFRLVKVLKRSSAKYTRSKVRKALPKEYAYILEELINEDVNDSNKQMYYKNIIKTIIDMECEKELIIAISKVIQRLIIDHLHIIGDIFDRGPYPDKVMDLLKEHHSLDIQWGNHDISWIGANAGNEALICNVIRICAKYNNLSLLEDAYGINLVPLVRYAMEVFKDADCDAYRPANVKEGDSEKELILCAKIHKAITLLQFKVEAELINRRPEYNMQDRILIDKIDFDKGVLKLNKKEYQLKEKDFQSYNKQNPLHITEDEREVLSKLKESFVRAKRLSKHIEFLVSKGEMYTVFNSNLLFHGCVPMNEDGTFRECEFLGKKLKGKELIDEIDKRVRDGYYKNSNELENEKNTDLMWYLWCGECSPLFGKNKMATFENYFVEDKTLKTEQKDHYFDYRNDESVANYILNEFVMYNRNSKIINGHVPVKVKKGESPVKANGKLIVIDGGLTKAYQKVTGIAGYTLISNSVGLFLAEHDPFTSLSDIIENGQEVISNNTIIERYQERVLVKDTDTGKVLSRKIEELRQLLQAYKKGWFDETL